jgi:hypothetical protein
MFGSSNKTLFDRTGAFDHTGTGEQPKACRPALSAPGGFLAELRLA